METVLFILFIVLYIGLWIYSTYDLIRNKSRFPVLVLLVPFVGPLLYFYIKNNKS